MDGVNDCIDVLTDKDSTSVISDPEMGGAGAHWASHRGTSPRVGRGTGNLEGRNTMLLDFIAYFYNQLMYNRACSLFTSGQRTKCGRRSGGGEFPEFFARTMKKSEIYTNMRADSASHLLRQPVMFELFLFFYLVCVLLLQETNVYKMVSG